MNIVTHFQNGGPFMYAILAFGIFSIALILERLRALYFQVRTSTPDFRERVQDYFRKGDLKGAEVFCKDNLTSSLARIASVGVGLRASGVGEEEVQSRMDEALTAEISSIDTRTGFLAMLGNVAMLLGLLGTVTGMIVSFAAIAEASPVDRATLLSKGIAEAMNTTAFGLMVAIPALIAYAIFQNKTDKLVEQLTQMTTRVYHDLIFSTEKA